MQKKICSFLLLSVLTYAGAENIVPRVSYLNDTEVESKKQTYTEIKEKSINNSDLKKLPKTSILSNKRAEYYLGFSFAYASLDAKINEGILANGHPLALVSKFGYGLHSNFGLEVRVGKGITRDEIGIAKSELSSLFGVYLNPKIALNKKVNLFGLIGYGTIKQKIKGVSVSSDGLSYGFGTSYSFDKKWNIVVDIVQYEAQAIGNNDTYGLGLEYKF